jgi:hypothetical protein
LGESGTARLDREGTRIPSVRFRRTSRDKKEADVVIGIAIAMGILGGLVVKALFLKESNLTWDAIFGLVGGVAAYFLYRSLNVDVLRAVFALGTAVVVAGVLHEVWTRFGKTA